MTTYEPLDRSLATLFAAEAAAAAPFDLADRIVASTARLRPRPTWRARLNQASSPAAPSMNLAGQPIGRSWVLLAIALVAAVAVVGAMLLQERPPTIRGVFAPAGSLGTPATTGLLLPDGQVLVFGGKVTAENGFGSLGGMPESILLYDPASGTSREIGETSASVSFAVPLEDGRVLAIQLAASPPGGGSGGGSSASLVDPERGSVLALGPTSQRHLAGAGVQLRDGQVLLVGDADGTTEAELFDPATGRFTATGSTSRPMMQPTATLLPDGRVLVVGAREPIAELYDPATSTFIDAGPMAGPREAFTATLLQDGRVLIAGGWAKRGDEGQFPAGLSDTAEVFDPATGSFAEVGALVTPRLNHFAVALADGRVLIGGGGHATSVDVGSGETELSVALQAELFDPTTGTFSTTGSLSIPRYDAGAVLLPNGRVLVIGTVPPSGIGNSDELLEASSLEVFE